VGNAKLNTAWNTREDEGMAATSNSKIPNLWGGGGARNQVQEKFPSGREGGVLGSDGLSLNHPSHSSSLKPSDPTDSPTGPHWFGRRQEMISNRNP